MSTPGAGAEDYNGKSIGKIEASLEMLKTQVEWMQEKQFESITNQTTIAEALKNFGRSIEICLIDIKSQNARIASLENTVHQLVEEKKSTTQRIELRSRDRTLIIVALITSIFGTIAAIIQFLASYGIQKP